MPLLMCPNDNTAMQEIDRNGVRIDVCPECRGVWLDRGELEKLLSLVERGPDEARRARPEREAYREREEHRDRPYEKRKKKSFDLFDFFG